MIVIGAGVTGAAIARSLAHGGAEVLVLDAAPGIGGGCSYANAALLAPGHVTPLVTPPALVDAARQLTRRPSAVRVSPDLSLGRWLPRLVASGVSQRVQRAGTALRGLAHHSAGLHAQLHQAGLSPTYARIGSVDVYLRQHGRQGPWSRDLLSGTELRGLEPSLGPVWGGSHHDDEASTESRSFIESMLAAAGADGARTAFGERAQQVLVERGRVVGVRTDGRVVRAPQVVISSGLGATALAADVGLRLPLRGGRGYVVDLARTGPDGHEHEGTPQLAVRLKEHRVVVTPLADRIRVAGYLEFGDERRPLDRRRSRRLVEVAARAVPSLRDRAVVDVWAGERPCLRDGLPAIGGTDAADGLSLAVGHGMWGLILAPATAELIAGRVLGTGAPIPAEFDPDRFRGRRAVPA